MAEISSHKWQRIHLYLRNYVIVLFLSNISCLQLCQMFYRDHLCELYFQILDRKHSRRPPNFPSDLRHCCLGPFVSQMEYDANRSCAPCVWWSAGLAWCAAVLRKRRRCERCPTVWSCHSAAAPDEDAGRETPSLSYDCVNLPRAVCRTTCLCDPRLYASSKAVRQWQRIEMQIRVHNPHRRRLHRSLREGGGVTYHPNFYKWLGTGVTVSGRTANKKLGQTVTYWPSWERSPPKRLIVLVEPKAPDVCSHFQIRCKCIFQDIEFFFFFWGGCKQSLWVHLY